MPPPMSFRPILLTVCEVSDMNNARSFWVVCLLLTLFGPVLPTATAGQDDLAISEPFGRIDLGDALSGEELEEISGRQGIEIDRIEVQWSTMNLNAQMGENVLFSDSTGMNIVTQEAFSNASGIATVIQNSGNQVIINNALILNLRME